MAPSTSDMDIVAGLGYLSQHGLLKSGDAIGAVYIAGLGEPQMAGVDYAASQLGLKAVKIEVQPTDTDLSSQLQQFKNAGVKAIVAAGLPTQTAAAAAGETAVGLNVPIVTGTAGFVSSLTTGPGRTSSRIPRLRRTRVVTVQRGQRSGQAGGLRLRRQQRRHCSR